MGKRLRKLTGTEYEHNLEPLLAELSDMARWVSETGQRVLVILEGRDTAGKGGAIQAIQRPLNPRQCRVVALSSPTDREKTQWYFQRYVPHLPAEGEIVLFDRSWYNRAGVEQVMGFATDKQVDRFLDEVPAFEQMLVDDGIMLFKYWLCCDQEKQEKRFLERLENPMKRWKLSPIDLEARQRYDEYTKARERMLKRTHSKHAPWTLVDFNNQGLGRLTLIRDLLDRLPDTKLPIPVVDWPPLPDKPSEESYGVLKPIKPVKVELDEDGSD
jgi:polyphosphate kinase 2